MKDYSQIVTKVTSTPWMITPDALRMMLEILDAHMSGNMIIPDGGFGDKPAMSSRRGRLGIMNLSGPMFPKANMMTEMSGATSLEQFSSEFSSLIADNNVHSVVLNIDSPGGVSDMVHETAMLVRNATQVKPVYAIANTAANSAAYYIASQASKLYATDSGQVGSVGTLLVHTDEKEAQEQKGIRNTVIKAGRFKAANMEPLTEESHGQFQQYVNEVNDQFVRAVAEGRGVTEETVREKFGEGMVVTPTYAVENGMIDGILTYDELVSSLTAQEATSANTSVAQTGLVITTASDNTAVNVPIYITPGRTGQYDKGKEHSEPGTGLGGEPTPREAPEKGDKAIEGGWRRDPPPVAYEETEESAVNRTWLEERATALGIEFDAEASDEDLAQNVAERMDEIIVPMSGVAADVASQRALEADYPDQARQLAELIDRDRQRSAKEFSDTYTHFTGTSKGFSSAVRTKIEEAYMKVSTRQFSHNDLRELLDLTADKTSVVEWGEAGSSREGDDGEVVTPTQNFAQDRQKFAELVRAAMSEDNLSQQAAIALVSQQHPELAQSYLSAHVK